MLTLKEKLRPGKEKLQKLKSGIAPFAVCLLSLIFCNFRLGESFYPLVLTLPSVAKELLPFSLLGTSLGIFIFLMGRNSLKYLAALLLSGGARLLFPDFFKNSEILNAAFSSGCLFLVSLPFLFSDFSVFSLLLYLSEALICFCSSLILKRCADALEKELPLNSADFLALGLASAFIYISSSDFKLLGLSIAKILFVSVNFALSLHFKPAFSLSFGILMGLCGFIKEDAFFSLAFPSGALAACAFAPAGKILSAFAYFMSSLFFVILRGIDDSFIYISLEIAAGLFAGLFLPKSLFKPLDILKEDTSGEILKNASAYRLLKTSNALSEIGAITEKVSKEFEKLHGEPMEKHIKTAIDISCRNCKNSPTCWQRYYDRTTEEVQRLFADGKNGLPLDMDAFRKATDCINCNSVEDAVKEESRKYAEFLRTKASSQSIRFIMCDQFSGFSELLMSLKEEVSEILPLKEKETRACEEILKSAGSLEEGSFAGRNKDGTLSLSFLFPAGSLQKISTKNLTEALSEELKTPLCEPVREKEGRCTRLFWHTEPPFSVEFDYYQRASENKRICGDSFETAVSLSGNPLFFLSDGMGVGGDAAVDSTMTTCLLSRLMASGASFPSALKLVSASLLSIKDERLCTVDFLSPDLFKGTLTFYKAGAAPSYLLRDGRCFKIGKSALPAGILGGAEAASSVFSLKKSDLVLMVTDGITETGEDWLLSSLPPLCDLAPIEICKEIIELASKRSLTGRCDDMTAAVIKFTENI